MVENVDLTYEDFPEDEKIKPNSEREEGFKNEFNALMRKYKVKDYVCGVSFDKDTGFVTANCSDIFLETHVEMCEKGIKGSNKHRKEKLMN